MAGVEQGRFTLTVDDDGRGVPAGVVRSGLENARARAVALGAICCWSGSHLGGARLLWTVPLAR